MKTVQIEILFSNKHYLYIKESTKKIDRAQWIKELILKELWYPWDAYERDWKQCDKKALWS